MRQEDDVIAEAEDLVSIRSTASSGERELVESLRDRFESSPVAFDIEIQGIDGEDPARQNIIARAGDPARGTLLLTGHLDVVPAVESDWSVPPFALTRSEDRLIGRGIADMKGSLASMLLAAEEYLSTAATPGEVILAFVAKEETGGDGTRELVRRGIDADAAILGEPTNLTIGRANKGAVRYDVVFEGESAHSGRPDRGINAISAVPDLLKELAAFDTDLDAYTHDLLCPASTVTVTELSAGTAPNIVPNQATVTFDWRFFPDMPTDPEWYDAQIRDIVDDLPHDDVAVSIDRWNFKPAAGIESGATIVSAIEAALGSVERDRRHTGFNAGTDAGYLVSAGIPTVLFGPGSIENEAHTVDESVSAEELRLSRDVYREAISWFFGNQDP